MQKYENIQMRSQQQVPPPPLQYVRSNDGPIFRPTNASREFKEMMSACPDTKNDCVFTQPSIGSGVINSPVEAFGKLYSGTLQEQISQQLCSAFASPFGTTTVEPPAPDTLLISKLTPGSNIRCCVCTCRCLVLNKVVQLLYYQNDVMKSVFTCGTRCAVLHMKRVGMPNVNTQRREYSTSSRQNYHHDHTHQHRYHSRSRSPRHHSHSSPSYKRSRSPIPEEKESDKKRIKTDEDKEENKEEQVKDQRTPEEKEQDAEDQIVNEPFMFDKIHHEEEKPKEEKETKKNYSDESSDEADDVRSGDDDIDERNEKIIAKIENDAYEDFQLLKEEIASHLETTPVSATPPPPAPRMMKLIKVKAVNTLKSDEHGSMMVPKNVIPPISTDTIMIDDNKNRHV